LTKKGEKEAKLGSLFPGLVPYPMRSKQKNWDSLQATRLGKNEKQKRVDTVKPDVLGSKGGPRTHLSIRATKRNLKGVEGSKA